MSSSGLDTHSALCKTSTIAEETAPTPGNPKEVRDLLLSQRAEMERMLSELEGRRWPWTWGGVSVKKQREQLSGAIEQIDHRLANIET